MPIKITFHKLHILQKKFFFNFYYSSPFKKKRVNSLFFNNCDKTLTILSNDFQENLSKTFNAFNSAKHEALSRCQAFLNTKEFSCLGYGIVKIDNDIDWHGDCFRGFNWKNKYFNNIDYVAIDEYCDVKVPWEISRFQYLLYLSEGHVLDRTNEQYKNEYCNILDNWILKNKTGYGINWTISMEVSIRAINLCLSLIVFWKDLGEDEKNRYLILLYDHLQYLKLFPEISDVPGNHHLAGLMGIFIIESIFFDKSSSRLYKSFINFSNEAKLQFEESGIHFERSPTYHRLCIDMVTHVLAFNERIGFNNDVLIQILNNGNNFSSLICNHRGLLPIIGDNDSGHITWFGRSHRDFSNNLIALNIILGKKNKIELILSDSIWISIISNKKIFLDESKSVKNETYKFAGGGFLVIKDENLHAVMRVGSQGLKGRASHDHDDSLSVWLSHKGQDFLVEKGCHSYTLNQDLRLDYLTSLGHNLVQRLDQSRFKPSQGSIVKTVRGVNVARNWFIDKETDLQNNMSGDITSEKHSKEILIFQKRDVSIDTQQHNVIIKDNLEWRNECISDQRWHFESSITPKIISKNKIDFYKNENLFCKLDINSSQLFELFVFGYKHSFHYGKNNDAYGVKIIYEKSLNIQSEFTFTFQH